MLKNPQNIMNLDKDLQSILKENEEMIKTCAKEIPDCNIHTLYCNPGLNADYSRIMSVLRAKKEREKQMGGQDIQNEVGKYNPIDKVIENGSESAKQPDNRYSKVPQRLKDIIESQLKNIEEKYEGYANEEKRETLDNFGKGINAWIIKNIINPMTGILYSLTTGNIIYPIDEDLAKDAFAWNLKEAYSQRLSLVKTKLTDELISEYFKEVKKIENSEKGINEQFNIYIVNLSCGIR